MGIVPRASPQRSHGLANPKASGQTYKSAALTSRSPRALHPPREKTAQSDIERPVCPKQYVIHLQIAAHPADLLQEILELRLIGAAQRARLCILFGQSLESAKTRRIL